MVGRSYDVLSAYNITPNTDYCPRNITHTHNIKVFYKYDPNSVAVVRLSVIHDLSAMNYEVQSRTP